MESMRQLALIGELQRHLLPRQIPTHPANCWEKQSMSGRISLPWIKDEVTPQGRTWEEFYRNRWQHDKIVRSTHGVNCTGGCTWQIHVKDGIVTWEMQGLDYPSLENGLPPYEPRGCQRGISFSWYLYSPIRVKYPYIRGALLDLWRKARAEHEDPVAAWKALVENPESRQRWQRARGKGGFRRIDWDTVLEIMAAANIHTIKSQGPDRGLPYFTLEFVFGGSLSQKLSGVPLPPLDAARLAEQLARGMHYAHQRGIIHRDLKPANVLLAISDQPSALSLKGDLTAESLSDRFHSEDHRFRTGRALPNPYQGSLPD
jgi:anaerobic selenocysteine-containing dehydrogenase